MLGLEQVSAVTAKKKTKKKAAKVAPPDLRDPLAPTKANMEATLKEVESALKGLTPPEQPHASDLVHALVHILAARGLPCGIGQEVNRRFEKAFVDRNEFRLTEAFELQEILDDLDMPDLFERCRDIRKSVAEVYNDQNGVTMEFLREASVADRNQFYARLPSVPTFASRFVTNYLSFEEMLFSDRSTLRLQQRMGMDPKVAGASDFLDGLRQLCKPFGHMPLWVADPDSNPAGGLKRQPVLKPVLSAASLVLRLAPTGKK